MIHDFGVEMTLIAPVDDEYMTLSDSVDLAGGSDGVAAALAGGEPLYLQLEVTTAFVASGGSPRAQFGVLISKTSSLTEDEESIVLGMTGGQANGTSLVGLDVGQLTLGRTFHLPIPRFDEILEATGGDWPNTKSAASLAAFRTYRYLGICCQNPTGLPAVNGFSAGAVKARLIHRMGNEESLSHTYASRMGVV